MGKSLRRVFARPALRKSQSDAKEISQLRSGWWRRTKNEFVPRWTTEWGGGFPASLQDARFGGDGFQPLCGWLISGCPCRDDYLQMLVRKSFSWRAKASSKASWFFQFEKSGMCYLRTSSAKSSPVSE